MCSFVESVKIPGKMAIFIRLVPLSRIIGLDLSNHQRGKWINVILRSFTLLMLSIGVFTALYYLIFEANSFIELSASYTVVNMMLYGAAVFVVMWRRWKMMTQMIESIRSKISERQYFLEKSHEG